MTLTQPQSAANALHGSLIYSSVTSHLRVWDGDTWLVDFLTRALVIPRTEKTRTGQGNPCLLVNLWKFWKALSCTILIFFILDPSSHILWLILILSYGPGIKPCFIEVQWDLEYVNPLRSKTSLSAMNFEFIEFLLKLWTLKTNMLIMQRSHALPTHFAISWRLGTVLRGKWDQWQIELRLLFPQEKLNQVRNKVNQAKK